MLAVLKADAVYVPLDDQSPPERNAKIVSHCRPRVVLCDADTVGAVIEACSSLELPPRLIRVGTAPRAPNDIDVAVVDAIIEGYTNGDLEYSNIDEDLAQIIYTSGSSGHPKGVMITHRSLADYITWGIEYFALGPEQRVLSTAPFHFDMSTFDIYCPLGAGAMLSIASREQVMFPAALAKRIAAEGVTHWKAAASLFTLFARAGLVGHRSLRSLRHVAFSGERAPTKYVAEWMKAYPETTFYNAYGPTEATGVSVVQRIEHVPNSPDEDVPIGRACANTEVALFDDSAGPVPRGAQGEIWIRGSCLSAGYWRDLELTAEHFVIRKDESGLSFRWYRSGDIGYVDEEGLLHFVGRLDDQVKHLGYRIELEEVNMAISTLRCVADSAVMLLSSRAKGVDTIVMGLFSLDGRPHLKLVHVQPPDLDAYRVLVAGGAS